MEIQKLKQTVYLPVKVEGASGNCIPDKSLLIVKEQGEMDKYWDSLVKPQEAFVFTPEELNEYTTNVIKQALETAAENAKVVKDLGEDLNGIPVYEVTECYYDENGYPIYTEEESITNTFDITFKQFKV